MAQHLHYQSYVWTHLLCSLFIITIFHILEQIINLSYTHKKTSTKNRKKKNIWTFFLRRSSLDYSSAHSTHTAHSTNFIKAFFLNKTKVVLANLDCYKHVQQNLCLGIRTPVITLVTSHCKFTVQLRVHLFISPASPNFVNCFSHHGDGQHKTLINNNKRNNQSNVWRNKLEGLETGFTCSCPELYLDEFYRNDNKTPVKLFWETTFTSIFAMTLDHFCNGCTFTKVS